MPPITKDEAEGTEYDLFVIGGGSGGLACAVSAADQPFYFGEGFENVVPG